jgi:hypothetical protein
MIRGWLDRWQAGATIGSRSTSRRGHIATHGAVFYDTCVHVCLARRRMRSAGFGSLGARRARPWRRPRPLVVTSRAQQLNAKKARPLTRLIPWFARGEHVVCVSPLLASARKRHCTVPWNAAVRAWVTAHSARPTRQVRLSCNTHGLVGCTWLSCREVCGPPNGHGGLVRSRPSVSALMASMTARSVAFRCGSFSWWSSEFGGGGL